MAHDPKGTAMSMDISTTSETRTIDGERHVATAKQITAAAGRRWIATVTRDPNTCLLYTSDAADE